MGILAKQHSSNNRDMWDHQHNEARSSAAAVEVAEKAVGIAAEEVATAMGDVEVVGRSCTVGEDKENVSNVPKELQEYHFSFYEQGEVLKEEVREKEGSRRI